MAARRDWLSAGEWRHLARLDERAAELDVGDAAVLIRADSDQAEPERAAGFASHCRGCLPLDGLDDCGVGRVAVDPYVRVEHLELLVVQVTEVALGPLFAGRPPGVLERAVLVVQ